MKSYDFYVGREYDAQGYLGSHVSEGGVVFRTFAPAADGVVLLLSGQDAGQGDGPHEYEMHAALDGNFWEVEVAGAREGDAYEYRISHAGTSVDHADPFGRRMELRPAHRSIVCEPTHDWQDGAWMGARASSYDKPMNIYELNLGSWRKRSGEAASDDPADWYHYDELAQPLVDYLHDLGYNYVEFMPLSEYPFDGSWGYQPTGFFAPTSRYGTPEQLMYLVDTLHRAGIGCILDIVPVHFATDSYGLATYDGTALFEYPHEDVGVSEWGSHNFMYSRGETRSLMQSSANMWLRDYHFDGLRMDAISRIIYWQGDEARGVNGNAVDFVRSMNSGLKRLNPSCILIAEDSTNFKGTTRPTKEGGLGFDYKWDMGWMHDTLDFLHMDPYFRGPNYGRLSFSMMYFPNERYLLPLSHDEVVHGKGTIVQKMWGELDQKFPQARSLYLYMMTHPGKKLSFMGFELAQLREWDERREQDWSLRGCPDHEAFWRFCEALNHTYLDQPALWERDYDPEGFEWRDVTSNERVCFAFERKDSRGGRLLTLLNLSGVTQEDWEVELPDTHNVWVMLDTDWQRFGGTTPEGAELVKIDGDTGTLSCTLPAFTGLLLGIS